MKIIGYFTNDTPPERHYLDEIVKFTSFSDMSGDVAIDITNVDLLFDPRPFLKISNSIGAWYGDFLDHNGNYCIHGIFPSIKTVYPGLLFNLSVVSSLRSNNVLSEIANSHIVSYIPETLVKVIL
jgi:hypothetical protein